MTGLKRRSIAGQPVQLAAREASTWGDVHLNDRATWEAVRVNSPIPQGCGAISDYATLKAMHHEHLSESDRPVTAV